MQPVNAALTCYCTALATCSPVISGQPAILLVHGFGGNADHFRKNIMPLHENGFNVFAIDLLGCVLSTHQSCVHDSMNAAQQIGVSCSQHSYPEACFQQGMLQFVDSCLTPCIMCQSYGNV